MTDNPRYVQLEPWQAICEAIRHAQSWYAGDITTQEKAKIVMRDLDYHGWELVKRPGESESEREHRGAR